jgi:hypothetical protein
MNDLRPQAAAEGQRNSDHELRMRKRIEPVVAVPKTYDHFYPSSYSDEAFGTGTIEN